MQMQAVSIVRLSVSVVLTADATGDGWMDGWMDTCTYR